MIDTLSSACGVRLRRTAPRTAPRAAFGGGRAASPILSHRAGASFSERVRLPACGQATFRAPWLAPCRRH